MLWKKNTTVAGRCQSYFVQLPALQEMMKSFYRCTETRFERFELYSFFGMRLCCHPFLGSQLAMMMCWVFGAFSIHPVTHSHEFDTHDTDVVKLGIRVSPFYHISGDTQNCTPKHWHSKVDRLRARQSVGYRLCCHCFISALEINHTLLNPATFPRPVG